MPLHERDMDEILFYSFFSLVLQFSKKFLKNELDSIYLVLELDLFILTGLLESHPAGSLSQNRSIVRYRKKKNDIIPIN